VAASGSASTDDVTINSLITAASADIYAGDSVTLGSSASVVSSDAEIAVGTNYNSATATTSSGSGSGTIEFSSASVLNGLTVSIDGNSFLSPQGAVIDPVVEIETSGPVFEEIKSWDNISIDRFIYGSNDFDNFIEPDNSGEIDVDGEDKSSFYFRRFEDENEFNQWETDDLYAELSKWSNIELGPVSNESNDFDQGLISKSVTVTEED
jgi:hypothetical protein